MTRLGRLAVALISVTVCSSLARAGGATSGTPLHPSGLTGPVLDAAAVRDLVNNGDYNEALKALVRVIALKGAAAEKYDRDEMLTLKAECHLQLRQNQLALDTLHQAAKEADVANNAKEIIAAQGFAYLIQKSPGYHYRPKTGYQKASIEIMDRTARPQAYRAIFTDEMEAFHKEAWDARSDVKITPILEIASRFAGTRGAEFIATGATTESDKLGLRLSRWSGRLLNAALDDFRDTVIRIDDNARRRTVASAPGRLGRVRGLGPRNGLSTQDVSTLKEIIETADKIPQATVDLTRAFAHPLMVAEADIRAKNVSHHAHNVLTTDYNF